MLDHKCKKNVIKNSFDKKKKKINQLIKKCIQKSTENYTKKVHFSFYLAQSHICKECNYIASIMSKF